VTDDLLSSATEALRETEVDTDGSATRLRVRRSLEASHRGSRQLVGFLTGTGILLAGTMSWAFATGRAEAVWRAIVAPAPVQVERAEPEPPALRPAPARAPGRSAERAAQEVPAAPVAEAPAPAPEPAVVEAPAPVAPVEPAPAPVAPRAAPAPRIEALYRRAHELHFHGTDHAAAIAAWEAYLAAEPMGRFVAEARYNRALLLIRVGRYVEARAALAPYARGEIAGGYRRGEATQLLERLPASDRSAAPSPLND